MHIYLVESKNDKKYPSITYVCAQCAFYQKYIFKLLVLHGKIFASEQKL